MDQGDVESGFELVGRHVAAPADPAPPVADVTGTAIAPVDALVAKVTPDRRPRAARR